jgi:hypothetical protein
MAIATTKKTAKPAHIHQVPIVSMVFLQKGIHPAGHFTRPKTCTVGVAWLLKNL